MAACDSHREQLSAEIDGELATTSASESRAAVAAAHEHLTGCADCRSWLAAVTLLNRRVGLAAADPGPGLTSDRLDRALLELPRERRRPWLRSVARVALGVVGLIQTVLSVVSVVDPMAEHGMASMSDGQDMAGFLHMSHEFAAWNLALGVAFVVGSVWTRHLAGTLPVLAGFVAVLGVLSGIDLVHGEVDVARVVSHALVAAGLLLVAVIVAVGSSRPRWWPHAAGSERLVGRRPRGATAGPGAVRSSIAGARARHRDAA